MAKIFLVTLCLALAVAEPPSSYVPPQARNSLPSQYGAPAPQRSNGFGGRSGGSYSYNSLAENQFGGSSKSANRGRSSARSQPSESYGAPSNSFGDNSVEISAARSGQNRRPSNGQAASRGFGQTRMPTGFGASAPSFGRQSQFGAPAPRNQQRANQFNAPSGRFQQPGAQFNAPSARFQQPAPQFQAPTPRLQPATSSYARQQPSAEYGVPSSEYGAPFAKKSMDDDLAEPANYEYNYEVQAGDESGAEFGHQETREDDFAQGEYHVLLPDGRMQIVEYEADEEGFRPKIRYEETGYADSRSNDGPY